MLGTHRVHNHHDDVRGSSCYFVGVGSPGSRPTVTGYYCSTLSLTRTLAQLPWLCASDLRLPVQSDARTSAALGRAPAAAPFNFEAPGFPAGVTVPAASGRWQPPSQWAQRHHATRLTLGTVPAAHSLLLRLGGTLAPRGVTFWTTVFWAGD